MKLFPNTFQENDYVRFWQRFFCKNHHRSLLQGSKDIPNLLNNKGIPLSLYNFKPTFYFISNVETGANTGEKSAPQASSEIYECFNLSGNSIGNIFCNQFNP